MKNTAKYNLTGILIAASILEVVFWLIFGVVYLVVMDAVPGLRIGRPELWWLFLLGPVMFLFFWISIWSKNRRLDRFGDSSLLSSLVTELSSVNTGIKYILWRLAAGFLVLALINPQLGSKMAEAKVKGIDIIVALDVSNSMMAEDLSPNRLVAANRAISKMLEKLQGDRVGIIVFAGQAFVQLPITSDYSAGKLFLSTIDTDVVPVQGTDIGAAIDLSMKSFSDDSPAQKAIVVITDGENHEADAVVAAQEAAKEGIRVFTIGMGSPDGTPIPQYNGKTRTGFKKDQEGNIVVTKLNEQMLREIAKAGNGAYIRASNAEVGLEPLLAELNQIEKTDMGTVAYAEYEDRFQIFLALALACLILEFFLGNQKGRVAKRLKLFDR
ncbi:VWA domain-containing protein [Cryomorphaceae bacterium 1068]|nr:VWA domain-containing protein [Cryomorphaceae bacterium 1068]